MPNKNIFAPALRPIIVGGLLLTCHAFAQAQPSPTPQNPTPEGTPTPADIQKSDGSVGTRAQAADTYNPQVEININVTPDTEDDLVALNGSTTCTAKLSNPIGQDVTVVFNNSDDHVTFSGQNAQGHLTLVLPGNGNEVSFTVTGISRSTVYGNAIINAHENNVYTPIIGTKSLTVFYFDEAKASAQATNGYNLTATPDPATHVNTYYYGATDDEAVRVNSRIALKPAGVSLNAPQVADYRVSFVQNVSNYNAKAVFTSPVAVPYASTAGNGVTTLSANKSYTFSDTVPTRLLDGDPNSPSPYCPPLYVDTAIKFPGQTATSTDAPNLLTDESNSPYFLAKNAAGQEVGAYTYQNAVFSIKADFNDYAVLFDIRTRNLQAMRKVNWYLNVSSATPGKMVSANANDTAYDGTMVSTGPLANNATNPQSSRSTTMVTIPSAN